ncbi:Fast Kinase Domain-Containing Protein 5 [Manis pentadactyla]|nr:Fast Kinase Domain-Containing Protein 5 [Manis pentadactyla]
MWREPVVEGEESPHLSLVGVVKDRLLHQGESLIERLSKDSAIKGIKLEGQGHPQGQGQHKETLNWEITLSSNSLKRKFLCVCICSTGKLIISALSPSPCIQKTLPFQF